MRYKFVFVIGASLAFFGCKSNSPTAPSPTVATLPAGWYDYLVTLARTTFPWDMAFALRQ
jgi:hypothetical protein